MIVLCPDGDSREGCAPNGVPVILRRTAPGADVDSLPDAHRQAEPPGVRRNAGRRVAFRPLLLDQRLPTSSGQTIPQAPHRTPADAEKARSTPVSEQVRGERESQVAEEVTANRGRNASQTRVDIRGEDLPGDAPRDEIWPDKRATVKPRPPTHS